MFHSYSSGSHDGNLHKVTDGKTSLLLDCGLPWAKARKMLGFLTSDIGGILVSHEHKDHCAGVKDAAKYGKDIYMAKETRENLGLSGHRFIDIEPGKTFIIGTMAIKAFPLVHDVPNLGFIIASSLGCKMAYMTDTAYCKYRLPADLDILAIECNYNKKLLQDSILSGRINIDLAKRIMRTHFGLENVLGLLQANANKQLREIWLLHQSRDNADVDAMVKAVRREVGRPVYLSDNIET